ncbi:synaptotagmin-like protein 2 isoform X2 [Echeneis naucrates]|uniref:Synaptotagmin-like protein 2 n=1 Tax=Echeneis naucrates TaxID=173247 RepID=A0A665UCR2_ECHNA|nr:synaptotagmin-like protein 2 isoform X2 [Echeneis naucrates]
MIDLSHLTEEEQGVILAVLRRDAELKRAEDERIRKLEKILSSSSESDSKLKYLTGEWFYEAKSHRHMDKIHGSEIILASMKQRKAAGLDGAVRTERPRTPSGRGSDLVPPPKPARCLEALRPQEINDAEKENPNSAIRSPRLPRHNPFNRASLIAVEPPENNNDMLTGQDQQSSETEPTSTLRNHPAGDASQTSGSVILEGSSVGFKPVPRKRTFLSRHQSCQSETSGPGSVGSTEIIPASRRGLQGGSSGSSTQSGLKSQDETPLKIAVPAFNEACKSTQPSSSADEAYQQPLCAVSQVSSNSSLEKDRKPPSIPRDRPITYMKGHISPERETTKSNEGDDPTQRQYAGLNSVALHTSSIQDSERTHSSVGTTMRPEELSLPQSTMDPDPPVSYDLNFIDKSDLQTQKKPNQKHAFSLSTQATSPIGDDKDSIAKVLDWFNRSIDSSDWLNTDDGLETTKSSDKHVEISKIRREETPRKDGGGFKSERKKEILEIKGINSQRSSYEAKELRATERAGNKEHTEGQEVVQKDTREEMLLQELEDNDNESQPAQISHLKSFWEKSIPGHKILISKSIAASNQGQQQSNPAVEENKETVNNPRVGIHEKYRSDHGDERDQQLVIGPHKDTGDNVHSEHNQLVESEVMDTSSHRNNNDNSDYCYDKLLFSSSDSKTTDPDTERLSVTRPSAQPRTGDQPKPESKSIPSVKPNPAPDSSSRETPQLSKMMPESHMDSFVHTKKTPDSDKLCFSRNSPHMDYKPSGSDAQNPSRAQLHISSNEDIKGRNNEDNSNQLSMSPKQIEDRNNSSPSKRQDLPQQESTAERIKQLKSFWEQERNKPMFYSGKPKAVGNGKVARGANQAMSKRFTKSEYDLRSVGNNSGSDEEDSDRNHDNFTILPLSQRIETSPPILSERRTQFSILREFWDEATSDSQVAFPSEKPRSPRRKEPTNAHLPTQELKSGEPDIFRLSTTVEKARPAAVKASLSPQNRSTSPHDRQMGSGSRAMNDNKNSPSNDVAAGFRTSSKEREKSVQPHGSSRKEIRSPKSRKDNFSTSSSRGNSFRRANSMFMLSVSDENDQGELKMDVSPVHSHSRKQRQNTENSETLTPRARAFVPRDYRHYLGVTDKTSVHTLLAPAPKNEGPEGTLGCEYDLTGPLTTSTPLSSEERYSKKGNRSSQRPQWANYSSSDTGQESSVSSASETWSNSRSSSNRAGGENDEEYQNPVRKALKRAEARPKNLARSMEDITAPLAPISSIPPPSSSLFLDPEHLKKMSKSVPSFLQEEDAGRDTDSISKDSYHGGSLKMGSSLTDLTSSSSKASSLSGSVMTIYSGDFRHVDVQGNIQFSINYIQRLREFHIFVAGCQDLAAVDPKRARSDPYVKSYLVPDKANLGKRKTSVKKKTLNPTFNEILRYRVRMEYLRTQTLILSVWHHDTFGRNSFLGEVDVDLSKWDFDHAHMNNSALKARITSTQAPSNGQGELRLAIRYLPQITHSEGVTKDNPHTGEIHIWVKDCKNLRLIRASIDPYVKCYMLPDTSRKSRQKTRVLRRTADPVFNHTMVYNGIQEADLTEACVELTVWDRDRIASNLLGGVRIGAGTGKSYGAVVDWMDSTPYEVALWERMLAYPNEWVEAVLPLRMLNSSKAAFK